MPRVFKKLVFDCNNKCKHCGAPMKACVPEDQSKKLPVTYLCPKCDDLIFNNSQVEPT